MDIFGIEIRSKGNVKALFEDVDFVLQKNQIESGGVSNDVKKATLAHALNNMIKHDEWFDICTIDKCCNLYSICIGKERYAVYRAAHCLRWREMEPSYRQVLAAMILDDFRKILNPET